MLVACVGWCGGVNVGSRGPLKWVKGSVRRRQALSDELDQCPWKSPPSLMIRPGYAIGSVLSAMQASVCLARSCGR